MYSATALHSLSWFLLATFFFYVAVQRPLSYNRQILSILHILSIAICLGGNGLGQIPYSSTWVPFTLGFTLHTISVLVVEKRVVELEFASFAQQLKAVFRIWTNFRKLPIVDRDVAATSLVKENRGLFALLRCSRVLSIYVARYLVTKLFSYILRPLNITLEDFAPTKQSFVPAIIYRDLCLRMIISVQWIWSTYGILVGGHDILAIFFVSIFRWDLPAQWPALFGSISEAYSLRRFWGVFWHRLHVKPYEAYLPSFFRYCPEQQSARYIVIRKGFRALWMFLFSAICHALVNWLIVGRSNIGQEVRFFLSNYVLCLGETVVRMVLRRKLFSNGSMWTKLFGYAWTLAVFFSLVPAWQYSLIYPVPGF